MHKRKSGMSVESDNKCEVITLDMKLDIIERFDNGQSKESISRALGLNESTVWLILSKSNEYTEQSKVPSASSSMQCTTNRSFVLVEMECLLIIWLEDCKPKSDSNWYKQHNDKST